MNVRVDGRGVSREIADTDGKLVVQTETTPGSVGALTEGLTDTPGREVTAMRQRTVSSRQQIALDYLGIAAREFEQAARNRIRYVQLAREYGVTNAAIGEALGVTESAVRGLLERHGD
jgi:hypothetical protein